MYKIGISGKANSGKNTVGAIICEELSKKYDPLSYANIPFAAPIKAIIRLMFPRLPEHFITGSSSFRQEIIPGAFKNGKPLTVRQLHIDLGTELGRSYNEDIWIEPFDEAYKEAVHNKCHLVIVPDVRMRNEFNHLKKLGFYMIRLLRPNNNIEKQSNSITETEQNTIKDEEFDFILNNDGSLISLNEKIVKIIDQISQ